MSLREKMFHYINGIRSGIPFCCIKFWMRGVSDYDRYPDGIAATLYEERYGVPFDVFGVAENDKELANYVRCNDCFEHGRDGRCKDNGTVMHWLLK